MSTRTLIERYTILKGKLQKEIESLDCELRDWNIKMAHLSNPYSKLLTKQIRLHREALELLEDVYNGEDGEIT